MAKFGDILIGAGFAAGGLAQGLQAGFRINQHQQQIDLQTRQANLQDIQTFAEVMQPGTDPVILEMTMKQLSGKLGFSPDREKEIISNFKKTNDETKAAMTDYLMNNPDIASGELPLKMIFDQAMDDPIGTHKLMKDWTLADKAEERAVKGDLRDDKRLALDEQSTAANIQQGKEQTAISRANLGISAGHLKIAQQSLQNAQINDLIEHRREGMKAVENIIKIPDQKVRGVLLDKHNADYGLFDDAELIAIKEAPLETADQILDALNIKLKTAELYQKEQGGGLTGPERKGKLARRAAGEKTEDMPPDIQLLSPKQAQKELEGMSTSAITVNKSGFTKGQIGDMKMSVNDIDFGIAMNDRLIGMIEKNPNIAGASGMAARGVQSLTGTVSSLSALAGDAKEAGVRLSTFIDDPQLQAEIDSIITDPKVQSAKVVEAVLRLAFAKQMTTGGRINREQYEIAASQINITGLSNAKQVLTKLREANLIMKKKKVGFMDQINSGTEGVATEQDLLDEDTHEGVLNFLNSGE